MHVRGWRTAVTCWPDPGPPSLLPSTSPHVLAAPPIAFQDSCPPPTTPTRIAAFSPPDHPPASDVFVPKPVPGLKDLLRGRLPVGGKGQEEVLGP